MQKLRFITKEKIMDNYKEILDNLLNNEDSEVRKAVAEQGYGLEKLVDDEDWRVRQAVARQGYGLDKLVDDESWYVRQAAERVIKLKRETMEIAKNKLEPFEFVSKILNMDLETQNEIFPEVGSTKNIFKYFTFEEALERYNNWCKGSIKGKDADE
jgi:uncharacterized protein YcgL (UPF0745 family)